MKKREIVMLVLIGVIVIGTAIVLGLQKEDTEDMSDQRLWIERPEAGELRQELTLTMGEQEKNVILTVGQRKKTEEEIEAAFTESFRLLEEMLKVPFPMDL